MTARRPLTDLAEPLNVTKAAIYSADDRGFIGGTIRAGASRKISEEAFDYHSRLGYGRTVPPHGTPEARAYAEERGLAVPAQPNGGEGRW